MHRGLNYSACYPHSCFAVYGQSFSQTSMLFIWVEWKNPRRWADQRGFLLWFVCMWFQGGYAVCHFSDWKQLILGQHRENAHFPTINVMHSLCFSSIGTEIPPEEQMFPASFCWDGSCFAIRLLEGISVKQEQSDPRRALFISEDDANIAEKAFKCEIVCFSLFRWVLNTVRVCCFFLSLFSHFSHQGADANRCRDVMLAAQSELKDHPPSHYFAGSASNYTLIELFYNRTRAEYSSGQSWRSGEGCGNLKTSLARLLSSLSS